MWINELEKYSSDNVVLTLVGNKSDSQEERVVSHNEAASFAESLGIPYFETSCKEDIQVEEVFTDLVQRTHERFKDDKASNRSRHN